MKKYIITENQLEKLVNKLDEIWPFGSNEVKFGKLPDIKNPNPDPNKSDDENDEEYVKNIKPLTFSEFLKKSEEDVKNDPSAGAPDTKLNVQAQIGANRAEYNINKTDQALKNIAGKFYKGIYSSTYSFRSDNKMTIPEGLASIILTLAYSLDQKIYPDFKINYKKNVNYLQNDLKKIVTDGNLKTLPLKITKNPNDPNDIKIFTTNNTVVVHVDQQQNTKKIEFNNILSGTASKIETYFKDKNNIDIVNKAIGRKINNVRLSGKQLIVTF